MLNKYQIFKINILRFGLIKLYYAVFLSNKYNPYNIIVAVISSPLIIQGVKTENRLFLLLAGNNKMGWFSIWVGLSIIVTYDFVY